LKKLNFFEKYSSIIKMILVRFILQLITDDEVKIINWDIRIEVMFTALLSLIDPVTDILVIMEWKSEWRYNSSMVEHFGSRRFAFALFTVVGICILVLSQFVSTLVYVRWDNNNVTRSGVFLHLLGFGPVYHAMILIKNPGPHPWELKVGETNEVGAQTWIRYFHIRAVESVVEALPFTIFQTFVMVWTHDYDLLLMSSAVVSMVCTAFPIVEYINLRCYDHGIPPLNIIEKLIITSLWTWDMVARSLPVIYLTTRSEMFWVNSEDWVFDYTIVDYTELCLILLLGYILVGLCFLYSIQHGKKFKCRHILQLPALAIMLSFSSHPKLRNVGLIWISGVETIVRFFISELLAGLLFRKKIIQLRQLMLFLFLTTISGGLQLYFFSRMEAGHYKGYRLCVEGRERDRERKYAGNGYALDGSDLSNTYEEGSGFGTNQEL